MLQSNMKYNPWLTGADSKGVRRGEGVEGGVDGFSRTSL